MFRLLAAPNAQNRERSRKQGEAADGQVRINLRFVDEHHAVSGNACTKRKTQDQKRVLQKILCHVEILSVVVKGDGTVEDLRTQI